MKPLPTEEELLAGIQKWNAVARVFGFNELAKTAETLGELIYCRLARETALKECTSLGMTINMEQHDRVVLELSERMPAIKLTEKDIELMREVVRKHDESK